MMNSRYNDVSSENRSEYFAMPQVVFLQNDIGVLKLHTDHKHYPDLGSGSSERVVKSTLLPAKITAYLVIISWLLCLAFLYGWRFLNKISLDWPLTLTTQPSMSQLSDNPGARKQVTCRKMLAAFSDYIAYEDAFLKA